MKWIKRLLLGTAVAVAGAVALDAATYDADAWIGDYERLRGDMAQGYANLDWQAERRGINLAALDAETRGRLENAHSRVRATIALNDFVERFGDPHLRLALAKPGEADASGASSSIDAAPAPEPVAESCSAAGYIADDTSFALPFADIDGVRTVADGPFPAVIRGKVGVLRIAAFGEDRYLAACESAFRPGLDQRALQLTTRTELQKTLIAAIERLKRAGATSLLVDVTGNGGGTEWVSEAIALFTDRGMTRAEARIVGPTCDRRGVWRGEAPACSVFAAETEAPARIDGTGLWTGDLVILADRGSGSATEDYIAWLLDNGVAKIAGERTSGAGCG
jgi:hypothetical protein